MSTYSIHSRRIRVFLSSTFQDLQHERDYLVKYTFPAIRQIAEKRNVEFSVVDLRWGVTEEEAHQGKVIEICLNEVEETRPFFIGIIGSRYGWCPKETDLEHNQRLLHLFPCVADYVQRGLSMTEMEMEYGIHSVQERLYANFYLKDAPLSPEQEDYDKLIKLREKIEQNAEQGLCQAYSFSTPKQLGESIYLSLKNLLDDLYPESESNSSLILRDKQNFICSQLQAIYHNDQALDQLEQQVNNITAPHWLIAFNAPSGVGKSALCANWRKEAPNIIRTFLNEDLCTAQDALQHLETEMQSREIDRNNVIWMIDGLDSLSDEERKLAWIQHESLSNINIVVAARDVLFVKYAQAVASNTSRTFKTIQLPIATPSDIRHITIDYLRHFAKGLSEKQLDSIAQTPLFQSMLLLRFFLQEIIQFGEYEKLDEFMQRYLRATNEKELTMAVFERLEKDYGYTLVANYFGLLSMTRLGLDEETLQRYLELNALQWSAFYGAVTHLSHRSDAAIQLHSAIKGFAQERYANDRQLAKSWCTELRKIYKRQLRHYIHLAYKENFIQTFILSLLYSYPLSDNSYEHVICKLLAEVYRLDMQEKGEEYVFRHANLLEVLAIKDMEIMVSFMHHMKGSAKKLIHSLPKAIWFFPDILETLCYVFCTSFLKEDKKEIQLFQDYIKRRWFIAGNKQRILDIIATNYLNNPSEDQPIEDTWQESDIANIDVSRIINFAVNTLPFIKEKERIEHIEKQIDALEIRAQQEGTPRELLCGIYMIKSYCLYRAQHYGEDAAYFSKAIQCYPGEFPVRGLLPFLIYSVTRDKSMCDSIIEEQLHLLQSKNMDSTTRVSYEVTLYIMQLLYIYRFICKDAAERETQILQNIDNLFPEDPEQACNAICNIANTLSADGKYEITPIIYRKAAAVAPTEDRKVNCLEAAATSYFELEEYDTFREIAHELLPIYDRTKNEVGMRWALTQVAIGDFYTIDRYLYRGEAFYNLASEFTTYFRAVLRHERENRSPIFERRLTIFSYYLCVLDFKYHICWDHAELIQEAADNIQKLYNDNLLPEKDKYNYYVLCMTAARRYDKAMEVIDLANDNYASLCRDWCAIGLEENPEKRYQLCLDDTINHLRLWESLKPLRGDDLCESSVYRNFSTICRRIWVAAKEPFRMPIIHNIYDDPDHPLRLHALTSLLFYALITENEEDVKLYMQEALSCEFEPLIALRILIDYEQKRTSE